MSLIDKLELEEATKAYSEAQKAHYKLRAWYKSLENPSPQEELIWLTVKENLRKTAKRLSDIRDKISVSLTPIAVSNDVQDMIQNLLSAKTPTLKEIKKRNEKEELLIHWLEYDLPSRETVIQQVDKFCADNGYCIPYGERLTPEEWEKYKKAHPYKKLAKIIDDANTESEESMNKLLSEEDPMAMPPPFKSKNRPVLDIDLDRGKEDNTNSKEHSE